MKEILILGVGNLILQDEGIGIHVINKLLTEELPRNIDLLDGGTGGLGLIEVLQEYEHLIIIDATLDNNPPGTISLIKPKYSKDYPILLSAHEIGLKDMIDAMIIQELIPEIHLITVSVQKYNEIGLDLTSEVENAIPIVIKLIKQTIIKIKRSYKVIELTVDE